ncbi:hypothetical protein [Streptomyces canus]
MLSSRPPPVPLLERIASGEHMSGVCADLGISVNRARSYASGE